MKLFNIRNAFGLSFAVLLAACGAGNQVDMPNQTASMIQTDGSAGAQAGAATATQAATAPAQAGAATQVATATMPAPDCASDGCKGLRIIDANAEAFRYQAMHAATPQS
ncbi:MAG TPA: hypothetical protein VF793_21785 [Telluria sp.]